MNRFSFGCSAMLLWAGVVFAQAPREPEYVPGELLVKFKPGVSEETIASLKKEMGLDTIRIFKGFHLRNKGRESCREYSRREVNLVHLSSDSPLYRHVKMRGAS